MDIAFEMLERKLMYVFTSSEFIDGNDVSLNGESIAICTRKGC